MAMPLETACALPTELALIVDLFGALVTCRFHAHRKLVGFWFLRFCFLIAAAKLYLPKVNRSSGAVIDMWIKAKELEANTEYYLELLAKGIGKPKEEIEKDIQRPKYFQAQEAIDYGIADKIITSQDSAFEKRNYEELLAQSKAMRRAAAGPQAAPSGFR